jgi:hypothetical protein
MKQMEPRTVTISDNTYYIRPLPAFKAANMSGELASLALPILTGLTPLLGGENSDKGLMDIDLAEAAPSVQNAFSGISGDKLETLLKHLLLTGKNISVETPDSEKAQLLTEDLANEIFCEEVQDMFLLAFEVIRTNYNGFFKKLADRFGPAIQGLTQTAAAM